MSRPLEQEKHIVATRFDVWVGVWKKILNGVNAATEYFYDRNGNMTKDLNKGISSITYNSLNLPQTVNISNSINTYVYSAMGTKLSVSQPSKKTDYVGNMIYENNPLQRILVDGGYYEPSTSKYYFYLTDHLGNNRVVADQTGAVAQTNHYYPFGMSFADGINTDKQPYKYNGKELDTDRGLNWYDYDARLYDPANGRFSTIDPLAEKYYSISPYVYVLNNPIKYTDPTGMWIKGADGKPVTFINGQWSSNASADVQRVGNALTSTTTGTERLNYMLGHDEKISITLTNDVVLKDGGYSLGHNNRTGLQLYRDGSIKVGEHQIVINTGSIEKMTSQDAGENPYKGLTMEDAIGAVAGHESGHTEKENTKQSIENHQAKQKGSPIIHNLEARPNEIENKILDELKNKTPQ